MSLLGKEEEECRHSNHAKNFFSLPRRFDRPCYNHIIRMFIRLMREKFYSKYLDENRSEPNIEYIPASLDHYRFINVPTGRERNRLNNIHPVFLLSLSLFANCCIGIVHRYEYGNEEKRHFHHHRLNHLLGKHE